MRKSALVFLTLVAASAQAGVGLAQAGQTFADAVDGKMQQILAAFSAPGGAVAVTYEGKLAYAKGYGLADQDASPVVAATPTTLFRVGSVSKPVTALAILKLVEQGRLALDESAFAILKNLAAPDGMTEDPRLGDITVRHLLPGARWGVPRRDRAGCVPANCAAASGGAARVRRAAGRAHRPRPRAPGRFGARRREQSP